jgi:hypothetical protein
MLYGTAEETRRDGRLRGMRGSKATATQGAAPGITLEMVTPGLV